MLKRIFWFIAFFFYMLESGFITILFFGVGVAAGLLAGFKSSAAFNWVTGTLFYLIGHFTISDSSNKGIGLNLLMGGYITGQLIRVLIGIF